MDGVRDRGAPRARPVIVTVTPNAAIDRTVRLRRLEPGRRHEALGEHVQAGGKGVNVARLLGTLGVPVRAVVVVGGRSGAWIVEDLQRAGIPVDPVEAAGESRTCLELLETEHGRATQVHGLGVAADAETARRLLEVACGQLGPGDWLALCGSLAPGLPADVAARILDAARGAGARVALDTSGAALRAGWARDPDLLRVNREEAAAALGVDAGHLRPPPYAGPGRPGFGVISAGAAPFHAWAGERCWEVTPPHVQARNPIGCGDAMLAGLLAALAEGDDAEGALRRGTALAAADAESETAGRADPERGRALVPEVSLRRLRAVHSGAWTRSSS